jgi:hypothetical protein
MKVELNVSPEAEIETKQDKEGNIIGIVFNPLFTNSKAPAVLAYGQVTNAQEAVLDTFSLVVSGTTGAVNKRTRNKRVAATADSITPEMVAEARAAAEKEAEEEDDE